MRGVAITAGESAALVANTRDETVTHLRQHGLAVGQHDAGTQLRHHHGAIAKHVRGSTPLHYPQLLDASFSPSCLQPISEGRTYRNA